MRRIDNKLFISKNEERLFENVKTNLPFKDEIVEHYINFHEKERLPDLLGKTVRVSDKQFKEVNNIIEEICSILKIDKVSAFIYEDFYYGVESKGIKNQYLEISAKTIEDFTYNELKFLIAKELYNIKFKNTYYSTIIMQVIRNFENINFPGMGITKEALKIALYKWHRVMNFSSDNFGLILCGNINDSINAILLTILNSRRLVNNINVMEYIKQGELINSLDDDVYTNTKLDELIPYGPFRVKNLISYSSSQRANEARNKINIEKVER